MSCGSVRELGVVNSKEALMERPAMPELAKKLNDLAKDAARAALAADARTDLATKADLAELKADLIKWNVGAMAVLTAIFAAIVRLG